MWTPKRVLLLGMGIAFFLVAYGVYAFFLGGIDGLPALPDDFAPGSVADIKDDKDDAVDAKLIQAFGPGCPQLRKTFKFEVRKKNMVVAISQASFNEPDGRVKLYDLSVAKYKENTTGPWPEINTLQSDLAWLTFDKKITCLADTQESKMIAAELRGNVIIINNRHTPEKHDDLEVLIDNEPLFYDDRAGRIWSNGNVTLIDKQTRPDHTKIKGQGLEMLLTQEAPLTASNKKSATPKPKSDLSGVQTIMLKSAVEMQLFTESGFVAGAAPVEDANRTKGEQSTLTVEWTPAKKKPPEKSQITITTYGPFVYDVPHDVADFASPPPQPNHVFPDQVTVTRTPIREYAHASWAAALGTASLVALGKPHQDYLDPKGPQYDQMICDHLVLEFKKKINDKGDATDREIEKAHATSRPGSEVVLSLDTQNLACHCAKLDYECPNLPERGARTVLYGNPLEAVKDGHLIKAKQLILIQANPKGEGQKVVAQGPGQVDLFDRNPGKGHTTHAMWKGLLTSVKEREGDKDLDKLTLTEDAMFVDDEHNQTLRGQTLILWLEPNNAANEKADPPPSDNGLSPSGSGQKPRRLHAFGLVELDSPDMEIRKCDTLKLNFIDVPPKGGMLPKTLPPVDSASAAGQPGARADTTPVADKGTVTDSPPQAKAAPLPPPPEYNGGEPPLVGGPPANPSGKTAPGSSAQNEKPKRPIKFVQVHDLVADIERTGDKNDLKEMVGEGDVHITQEGEKPGDKGVDITGETVHLLKFDEGNLLKVYGNPNGPGLVQMNDMILMGPKVAINQNDNSAYVDGVGVVQMPPSATSFDGTKPNKSPLPITVHFTQDMQFDQGRDAEFHKNVIAYQGDSTLQCKTLQVSLDKPISMKEGQKQSQQSKVKTLVAHGEVRVHDTAKDPDTGNFLSSRRLYCTQLAVDNEQNTFVASGPGQAASLQFGETEDIASGKEGAAPKKTAAPSKDAELQLTRIDFQDRMHSIYIDETTRKTIFTGKVYVVHLPAKDLDAVVDVAKLPKGGMVMQSDKLTVFQRQVPNGKSTQTMEASRNVFCRTVDMFAHSEKMTFDDSTDIVTFYGSPGNAARVDQQIGGPGGAIRTTTAQTIMYNRKTGLVSMDSASGGNVTTSPN